MLGESYRVPGSPTAILRGAASLAPGEIYADEDNDAAQDLARPEALIEEYNPEATPVRVMRYW